MNQGCRFCAAPLKHTFCDLGMTPLSNAFMPGTAATGEEQYFPLHARVCGQCFLVQLPQVESPANIFGDYAYFSSYSDSWLAHAEAFACEARERFGLTHDSLVMEVASNDGYLLQYFRDMEIPVIGIEPAANVAREAEAAGISTRVEFFGTQLAGVLREEGLRPDLLVGNNVLAHVPDLNDFVAGLALVLADGGVISLEFPHLLHLIRESQFDTIYHEHFSYFSLATAQRVLEHHGLQVFDVEELATHGGSLRLFAQVAGAARPVSSHIAAVLEAEVLAGLDRLETYTGFQARAQTVREGLLAFLDQAAADGKQVAAYGAPAKGNTLLNYCGVDERRIRYTVDRNPHKQGTRLPGSGIPVFAPGKLDETRPDYVLILPWNLQEEIRAQMEHVGEWGGKFVIPIPELEVLQ